MPPSLPRSKSQDVSSLEDGAYPLRANSARSIWVARKMRVILFQYRARQQRAPPFLPHDL